MGNLIESVGSWKGSPNLFNLGGLFSSYPVFVSERLLAVSNLEATKDSRTTLVSTAHIFDDESETFKSAIEVWQ